jgi:hypothetical protein
MAKRSPSALSKELLVSEGYEVDTVERFIPGANIRKDLFGFGDLLAIHKNGLGTPRIIQTTSRSNVSARVTKIKDSPLFALVSQFFVIEVHGWYLTKSGQDLRRIIMEKPHGNV